MKAFLCSTETATLNSVSLDDFQETMMLKITSLCTTGNRAAEIGGANGAQEIVALNTLSLDVFQETMALKITSLCTTGNSATEISSANNAQEIASLNQPFSMLAPLMAFLNLSSLTASASGVCRVLWPRVRAWQLGFVNYNPPLNRSAQQRDLPTGKGHQRARLAPRWAS